MKLNLDSLRCEFGDIHWFMPWRYWICKRKWRQTMEWFGRMSGRIKPKCDCNAELEGNHQKWCAWVNYHEVPKSKV